MSFRHLPTTLAVAFLLAMILTPTALGKSEDPAPARFDPTTILVKFAKTATADTTVRREGDRVAGVAAGGVRVVRIGRGRTVGERVAAYGRRAGVVYAERNWIRTLALATPNDPSYGAQWGLGAIGAFAGWNLFPGSFVPPSTPKIAVIDTGVDLVHPDLVANLDLANQARCINFLACTSAPGVAQDTDGHGTHVAGIAAAVTNNGAGVAGVAYSSPVMPVKVFADGADTTQDWDIMNGINWAVSRGAKVINMSIGGGGPFPTTLCNAVANANASGVLVVVAAGNEGTQTPSYPAACPGAVGVAATASDGTSPDWSNWGSQNVFLSAPGDEILSTYVGSTYDTLTGTSMASPHTAGLAALLFGQAPGSTTTDVKRILAKTAERIGGNLYPPFLYGASHPNSACIGCTWHPYYGYGEIDAKVALCEAAPSPTISSFSPFVAPVGSSVTITGTNLACAASVSLNHAETSFTVDSLTQITATVPSGPRAGEWRVTTPNGTAVSPLWATVSSPTITSFSPTSGIPGSTVILTGTNFLGVTAVRLGSRETGFTVDSPTQITATVPSAPDSGRWRVDNPVWSATHPSVFTVSSGGTQPFTYAPATALPGEEVTLTGSFSGVTGVSLGAATASIVGSSPTELTVTVPAGVSSGKWSVANSGGTAVNEHVFTVASPTISSFSPTNGVAGSTVTMLGENFDDVTSVTIGYVEASFTVDSPTQITATVPPGVAFGRWRVISPAWTAIHPIVYTVTG
jgi:subtilisin family serine protease